MAQIFRNLRDGPLEQNQHTRICMPESMHGDCLFDIRLLERRRQSVTPYSGPVTRFAELMAKHQPRWRLQPRYFAAVGRQYRSCFRKRAFLVVVLLPRSGRVEPIERFLEYTDVESDLRLIIIGEITIHRRLDRRRVMASGQETFEQGRVFAINDDVRRIHPGKIFIDKGSK